MREDNLITLKGFLERFLIQHQQQDDRPFCFILGAGASKQSGIPAGSDMALDWVKEMFKAEEFGELKLEQWATADTLGITNFKLDDVGRFYPQLYSRRFAGQEEKGYAFLEEQMDGKEPSFGYSVLAYLLSETHHKIVITTNFDNLVADALSIHSNTFPIVVGHDSLAAYARVELRRPLIAKVHGGLGFKPKNKPEDLCELSDEWKRALEQIFRRYTPIVIGYDGNDGCLMTFLENLSAGTPDTVYWCFRSQGMTPKEHTAKIPERIRRFIKNRKGALVPIPGFDEMMVMLFDKLRDPLKIPDLFERLKERARNRENNYDEQQRKLIESVFTKPILPTNQNPRSIREGEGVAGGRAELIKTVEAVAGQRKIKPGWMWVVEANAEPDIDKKEQIYKTAVSACPSDPYVLGNYALFLKNDRRDNDRAEEFFKHAIDAGPTVAGTLNSYAVFLDEQRQDREQAERFFKRAVDSNPQDASSLGNYAIFLAKYFAKSRADLAEGFFKRAIQANPKNANNLGAYADFLRAQRKDLEQAEVFFKRAMEAGPNDANVLGGYAVFLQKDRDDQNLAGHYYKLAVERNPRNVYNLTNYAGYLLAQGDNVQGLQLLDNIIGTFLPDASLGVSVEIWFYAFIHRSCEQQQEALKNLRKLILEKNARSAGWDFSQNIKQAIKAGHSNAEWLPKLADVISEKAEPAILDEWPAWRDV